VNIVNLLVKKITNQHSELTDLRTDWLTNRMTYM